MSDDTAKLTINCCLCSEEHEQEITLPEGWALRYDWIDEGDGFCPNHAVIADFADAQCPGCVGGWRDCPLWSAFAYSSLDLSAHDFEALELGICPKRVNGTMGVHYTPGQTPQIEDINLSDRAPEVAGKALAQAIRDYSERYHNKGN